MRNSIRKHLPNFVDIDPPPDEEFSGIEELLKTKMLEPFKGYTLAVDTSVYPGRPELLNHHLMAVKDNGKYWWVIGTLKSVEGLDLPQWVANRMPDKPIII